MTEPLAAPHGPVREGGLCFVGGAYESFAYRMRRQK